MNPSKPRPGDILLAGTIDSTKGLLKAEDQNSKLLAVFLGTVVRGVDPDVPTRLEKLGWHRSVVYEVTAQYGDEDQRWAHRLNFTAPAPKAASLAAVRFARMMLDEERKSVEGYPTKITLLAITVRTMRLGDIDEEGRPHNGRGPAFVQWGSESGESLDDLVKKIEEA